MVEEIRWSFIADNASDLFGVVLGPTRTGKSHLASLSCNMYPHGCIYYEICEPLSFPVELAKAINMRLKKDANIFHVILDKVGIGESLTFYTLPDTFDEAMSYVLTVLSERALIFTKKHQHMPCVFIDGADLLVKPCIQNILQLFT